MYLYCIILATDQSPLTCYFYTVRQASHLKKKPLAWSGTNGGTKNISTLLTSQKFYTGKYNFFNYQM